MNPGLIAVCAMVGLPVLGIVALNVICRRIPRGKPGRSPHGFG